MGHHHHKHCNKSQYQGGYYGWQGYELPPPPHSPHQGLFSHSGHTHHKREHLAEVGALTATAFSLNEAKKAKEHVGCGENHEKKAKLAGLAALGAGAYAAYEHAHHTKGHFY